MDADLALVRQAKFSPGPISIGTGNAQPMGEPNVYVHSQTPHGSLRSSPVPDPLDTSRRLPLLGSGRPVLMGLPVFSVALALFLALFIFHASAADKTGGLGVAGEPQVDDAVCVTKCVDAQKATPGSKVRVEGD